ncbi:MAG: STAS domain-containing protein [Bacteroidota bacterium]
MDSSRMKRVIDGILHTVNNSDNDIIIIDLSNLEVIDSAIAGHLVKLNKTLQLVGMDTVFCGIKPIVAQSMVSAGVVLENIFVAKNLKRALIEVYRRQGLQLVAIQK